MKRIVFVDDDNFNRFMYETKLRENQDVCFKIFGTPEDALIYIKSNPDDIDVILTDYMMPNVNGGELISQAKELLGSRNIEYLIHTSVPSDVEVEKYGLHGIVYKKFQDPYFSGNRKL